MMYLSWQIFIYPEKILQSRYDPCLFGYRSKSLLTGILTVTEGGRGVLLILISGCELNLKIHNPGILKCFQPQLPKVQPGDTQESLRVLQGISRASAD